MYWCFVPRPGEVLVLHGIGVEGKLWDYSIRVNRK